MNGVKISHGWDDFTRANRLRMNSVCSLGQHRSCSPNSGTKWSNEPRPSASSRQGFGIPYPTENGISPPLSQRRSEQSAMVAVSKPRHFGIGAPFHCHWITATVRQGGCRASCRGHSRDGGLSADMELSPLSQRADPAPPGTRGARQGWNLPKVCTPLELMAGWTYEGEESSDS